MTKVVGITTSTIANSLSRVNISLNCAVDHSDVWPVESSQGRPASAEPMKSKEKPLSLKSLSYSTWTSTILASLYMKFSKHVCTSAGKSFTPKAQDCLVVNCTTNSSQTGRARCVSHRDGLLDSTSRACYCNLASVVTLNKEWHACVRMPHLRGILDAEVRLPLP